MTPMGNIVKSEIVEGDVGIPFEKYIAEHPELVVL
jgi:hypothetical protein